MSPNNNNSNNSNLSNLEFKECKNQNFVINPIKNLNNADKNNINEINISYNNNKNALPQNNFINLNKQNILVKQLKIELSQVLFGDKKREFKNENQASYFTFLSTQICCCVTHAETKKMFNFELNRIKKILNVETFQHYLTEAYAIQYKKLDE